MLLNYFSDAVSYYLERRQMSRMEQTSMQLFLGSQKFHVTFPFTPTSFSYLFHNIGHQLEIFLQQKGIISNSPRNSATRLDRAGSLLGLYTRRPIASFSALVYSCLSFPNGHFKPFWEVALMCQKYREHKGKRRPITWNQS